MADYFWCLMRVEKTYEHPRKSKRRKLLPLNDTVINVLLLTFIAFLHLGIFAYSE